MCFKVYLHLSHCLRGDEVWEGTREDFRVHLQNPETWYLVDGETPTLVEAVTFVAISPSHDLYWEYAKDGSVAVRYMPVWTLQELQKARRLVYPHVCGLTRQVVVDLYAKWGGVARYCLEHALNEAKQQDLPRAIAKVRCVQLADLEVGLFV